MPKYLCAIRPPGYAQIPDGWAQYDHWYPMKELPEFPGRHWHGWVEYPERLEKRVIDHWTLIPVDPKERAEMVFWDRLDGDAAWLKEDYMSQPVERLQEYANEHNDVKAQAALILLDLLTPPIPILEK